MDLTQREKIRSGQGFFAALDQSGGSTPKALSEYGIRESRYSSDGRCSTSSTRCAQGSTSPAFDGSHILAAILFEQTMDRDMQGAPIGQYLWGEKQIVPFLKVDKGLADERHGVQLMKPIDTLDDLLKRANRHQMCGTKMRSVIKDADRGGVTAIVDQQVEYAAQISATGLVPILEPEVSIDNSHKHEVETMLRDALRAHIETLTSDATIIVKLTLPTNRACTPFWPTTRRCCRCSPCLAGTAATKRANCWPRIRP